MLAKKDLMCRPQVVPLLPAGRAKAEAVQLAQPQYVAVEEVVCRDLRREDGKEESMTFDTTATASCKEDEEE
jgi:hypothetical protein